MKISHIFSRKAALIALCSVGVLWGLEVAQVLAQSAIDLPDAIRLDKIRDGDAVTMFNNTARGILGGVKYAFEGAAVFFMVYYGAMMILTFGNEEEIKNNQMGLIYSLMGFLMLNFASLIIEVVDPSRNSEVINQQALENLVYDQIITFIRFGIGSVAVAIIVYKGFRLVVAAGEEEQIKKDKQYILWAIIGLILITVARPIQEIIFRGRTDLGNELITTMTRVMYFIAPPIAIFFIIYGAVFMLTSAGDEEKYKRGITIIKGTVIALVIIYSAFTVVTEVLKFALS